jgi:hypothetical protein
MPIPNPEPSLVHLLCCTTRGVAVSGGDFAMLAFNRLSCFCSAMKERAAPAWRSPALQFERGLQWLRLRPQVQATLFSVSMGLVTFLLLVFSGVTAAVAALAAWITLVRHFAQTNADRQRRITESFAKAVEQLGSDKLVERLGGIYSLERISQESPDDYWTVMETLTAFVRERAPRKEPLPEFTGTPTDIAAVLSVITRRDEANRQREKTMGWQLDLRETDLRNVTLADAHLEGAILLGSHLKNANLTKVHLFKANLSSAILDNAVLSGAHLNRAYLRFAHLKQTILYGANLTGADLGSTDLEDAGLRSSHLEGADLRGATGLSEDQLTETYGDTETKLPAGISWPTNWSIGPDVISGERAAARQD